MNIKKGRQVGTVPLYINCRMSHCYGCVQFELNDLKSLYTNTILSKDKSISLYYYLGIFYDIILIAIKRFFSYKYR